MELGFELEHMRGAGTLLKIKMKEPLYNTEDIIEWNDRIQLIDSELSDLPFVAKKQYGKWLWSSEHELNRWLTYYHLRFEKEDDQQRGL